MPIYEYVCSKCSHDFEDLVPSSTSPAPPCPKCASKRVERRLSVFAVGRDAAPAPTPCGAPIAGGCGSCGDPRGPGACALD